MDKQHVIFSDLGVIDYKVAWDQQEALLKKNVEIKSHARNNQLLPKEIATKHYLMFCEHNPVYTLGKSGSMDNILLNDDQLKKEGIDFFRTNRGGDITFHGLHQVVGYPIFDLEKFYTDIGKYLRNVEEVIIRTIAEFDIIGERSAGETGVWIDASVPGKERKIAAIGVRCSRWITMHGFALNVNTDLGYFKHIIPCGIQNKQVTSIARELGKAVSIDTVKEKLKNKFEEVFDIELSNAV